MRIFAANRSTAVVVLAAALPRLAVLLHERGTILSSYVEKSDLFARTFVASGTYGFVPGIPSAYTQPLYGWFLIPLYWLDRTWVVVGLAQLLVATCTALIVLAIGRRELGVRGGTIAALVATLNPYLVWHDMHVNREIVDQLVAAALFLLVLAAARTGTVWLAAAAGLVAGVGILGNSRLGALPLVLAVYLLWRRGARRTLLAAGALVLAAVLAVAPWAIRNRVQVGCFAITTDAHALWKANNVDTYRTLAHGGWIDDVPALPGAPQYTPEYEYAFWHNDHRLVHVDECAQMRLYEHATFRFWRHHPGEKAKLIVQATRMLWQPEQTRTEGGPSSAGAARSWIEAVWAIPVYLLALVGFVVAPRALASLAAVFVAYETLEAWLFAGATRYRVSFDFVLALLAAAAIERLLSSSRYTASTPSTAASSEN